MRKQSLCGEWIYCAALVTILTIRSVSGQAGAVDPTFDPGTGTDSYVNSLLVQPDGKILIGGLFTTFNGTPTIHVARLNSNGSLATAFPDGQARVNSIALDSKNRILLATDGGPVRLNPDGTRDSSFTIPFNGVSYWIAPYLNDQIIVAGGFWGRIARLASDGSPLPFDTGHQYPWDDHGFYSCIIRSNGNIIVAGEFHAIDDEGRGSLAELYPTGALVADEFVGGLYGNPGAFEAIAMQPDGKVLAGGWYCCGYQGIIVRYTASGEFDGSFSFPRINGLILALAVQPDGKILVGGESRDNVQQTSYGYVARLLPDGTVDPTFDVGTGPNGIVTDIKVQPDGRILIAGWFGAVNGVPRSGIARLLGDAPVLSTQRIRGGKIVASWPAAYTDWVLQSTKNERRREWKTITTPPAVVSGLNYVTNRIGQSGKFYRLVQK